MAGSVAEGESNELSEKTSVFGLRSWVLIGIGIGVFVVLVLFFLSIWLSFRKRSRKKRGSPTIPSVCKEIPEVQSDHHYLYRPQPLFKPQPQHRPQPQPQPQPQQHRPQPQPQHPPQPPPPPAPLQQAPHSESSGKKKEVASHFGRNPARHHGGGVCQIGTEDGPNPPPLPPPRLPDAAPPPLVVVGGGGVPEVSHLGWGHWYTLRDLETATDGFLDDNVLGQGSYGIVYRGKMPDSTLIAVKNLLNNRGQAEKEFKVEVEAIGRVRHKNLVRLLGYCAEGSHRMLVYEYVENGNLSQWLHGPLAESNPIPWDARIKIVLGTAKGLAYLHEGLEPKVVHRDVKSSNILLDRHWNAKLSDFGLAKLLGSGRSHVATRVMGTFGYVAPEYANTGLLTERNDVYGFGVLLMEVITGRDPVDYARPSGEINLVDWLKMMVGSRRSDEVADPRLEVKPSSRALKRALLVALRCVDPDAQKRPKMGHVVHMLESEDDPFQNDRRFSRHASGSRDSPSGRGISKANTTQNVAVEKEEDNTQFGNKSRWKRYEA